MLDGIKIVSAVSTGGTPKKPIGRVGDSPLVGSGFYANSEYGAVSTGIGEDIMKLVLSYRVGFYLHLNSLEESVRHVIDDLTNINGKAGIIALDKFGNIAYSYNTKGMFFSYIKDGLEKVFCGY